MKSRILSATIVILVTFFSSAKAADIHELFLQMPSEILKDTDRRAVLTGKNSENGVLN